MNQRVRAGLARLDPRAKLAVSLGLCLLAALSRESQSALYLLGFGCLLLPFAGFSLKDLGARLIAVNLFVAFLWLFLPFELVPGGAYGIALNYRPSGLDLALTLTLKANAVFLALYCLLGTSPVNDVFHALAHFKLPEKLITLFLLFYRYVHVIREEYLRLRRAMRLRCFSPGNNAHTYASYGNLVGMLLARGFDRANRVYQAMRLRGFSGTLWTLDHFAWHKRDTLFCLASALVLGWLGWREI